jgi:hypothetical protein
MIKILKAVGLWILQGLIGAALIAFFVFMFLEWAAGCGESYTDSKGKVHITECLWVSNIPSQQVSKP